MENVGLKFEDLSMSEMNAITGGNGNERVSPFITVASTAISVSASLVSTIISYNTKK
ncbi:lichenicidin A2 family type 2 lantibiotic [Enterococcus sp. HMSC072H05]|uniref:lichenicidin A2 family type 2 lantibiotic n=1 Tax=Enterococcus sp. HMSC072H05 TaxID=1715012 RepID=UPI003563A75C